MLDPGYIYTNLQDVRDNCAKRNVPANVMANVERVVELIVKRKEIVHKLQGAQQRQNEISKLVAKEKDPARKAQLIEEGRRLRDQVCELEPQLGGVESEMRDALLTIPNLTHPDAPVGTTPADNK